MGYFFLVDNLALFDIVTREAPAVRYTNQRDQAFEKRKILVRSTKHTLNNNINMNPNHNKRDNFHIPDIQ